MQIFGSFYGYEQRGKKSRLFIFYATDRGVYGGWIAPCDFGSLTLSHAGRAKKWERHYAGLALNGHEFLEAHRDNFHFAPEDGTAAVDWRLRTLKKSAARFGALDLGAENGRKRRFYLTGRCAPSAVAALLKQAFPTAQVRGNPPSIDSFAPSLHSKPVVAPTRQTVIGPAPRHPNWPVIVAAWVVALGFSYVLATEFNFWWGIVACVMAPYLYKMKRAGAIAKRRISPAKTRC